VAYDNPIPGYATPTTSNLRLWDAEPVHEFDLTAFNAGDYDKVRGNDDTMPHTPIEGGREPRGWQAGGGASCGLIV